MKARYNELLDHYCQQHPIQHKIYQLFPPTFPATLVTSRAMEAIDRVITDGMIHAEKKCCKIFAGEVPFSVKLVKAGWHIKLWRLVIRHEESNCGNTRTIRRLANKCNKTRVLAVSVHTARCQLTRA